jgi:hypothetical protein
VLDELTLFVSGWGSWDTRFGVGDVPTPLLKTFTCLFIDEDVSFMKENRWSFVRFGLSDIGQLNILFDGCFTVDMDLFPCLCVFWDSILVGVTAK